MDARGWLYAGLEGIGLDTVLAPRLKSPSPRTPDNLHLIMLGRLAHYAFDAILLSTVAAGVKRTTGFVCVPDTTSPLADIPSYLLSVLIQSLSPTQPYDLSLNGISALAKPCSTQYKERQ